MKKLFFIFVFLITYPLVSFSFEEEMPDPVKIELIAENNAITSQDSFWVGIKITIQKGWHIYWKNAPEEGMSPSFSWSSPEGIVHKATKWPFPKRFEKGEEVFYGYDEDCVILAQFDALSPVKNGDKISLNLDVEWLACSEEACFPGDSSVKLNLPVASTYTQNPMTKEFFAKARHNLPKDNKPFAFQKANNALTISFQDEQFLNEKITQSFFIPEEEKNEQLSLNYISQKQDNLEISFKENMPTSQTLKGVLLLSTKDNKTYAYQVNHPIISSFLAGSSSFSAEVETESNYFLVLFFAFLGGLILNLMPCVFPILSIKIMGLLKLAKEDKFTIFLYTWAYTFGIMLSFWILAVLLLLLQTSGQMIGWGFQFQNPLFVGIVTAFLLIFCLNFFGIFEMGTKFAAIAHNDTSNEFQSKWKNFLSSLLNGMLAVIIASPCTGPFLGSTLCLASSKPFYLSLPIFTSLGLGMALPYLVFGTFPNLLRFLPKPGVFMITLREIVGFMTLAVVLWFTWIYATLTNIFSTYILFISLFIITIGCWVLGKWAIPPIIRKRNKAVAYTFVLMLFVFAFYLITQNTIISDDNTSSLSSSISHDKWEPYNQEKVDYLLKQNTPVFIDFTAQWCLTCQTNHLLLNSSDIQGKFSQLGVVTMKADWTKKDSNITQALRKFGRNSVPLYVLLTPENNDVKVDILPSLLTSSTIKKHLNDISQNRLTHQDNGL